jgi:hypothetical protein
MFRVIPVTVGDDAKKAHLLTTSFEKWNHEKCTVLGKKGGTDAPP